MSRHVYCFTAWDLSCGVMGWAAWHPQRSLRLRSAADMALGLFPHVVVPHVQVLAAAKGTYGTGPEASHRVIHRDGDRITFKRLGPKL